MCPHRRRTGSRRRSGRRRGTWSPPGRKPSSTRRTPRPRNKGGGAEVQAILLVGGFGTRLRPLTLTTPKQMLPVLDRPMLEYAVSGLAGHGVDRVVLALGYHDAAFRAAYPGGRCAGVELCCVVEPEPLDTAGAIRFAYEASGMGDSPGTFLVANGDVITDLDVGEMLHLHRSAGAEATIHLIEVDDPSRYGVVVTDRDGRVREFVEKPQPPAPSNWINAGTYLMDPAVIGRIDGGRRVSVEREVFPTMVEDRTLWALCHNTYWLDVGTPKAYLQAQLDLLDGRRGPAVAGVSAEASVDAGALIERSVVMAGAVVGEGSVVRGSAVHEGAVIEAGATVLDSVVGSGATVGRGARVTDGTLIGERFEVAPGTALSDARVPQGV
ncbi:MAG: NDP-sugar synthase [Acidimicrobiaceae bacterium]|nr:NDP-sugar synthase [Acidimicrobiaceae bacterium]